MASPAAELTAPPVVLVRIEYAGRTIRLSSRPIDVLEFDGVTRLYRGGISPLEVYQEGGQSGQNEPQSQTFEVLPDIDVAGLASEFHMPDEIRATVSQIVEGQSYGQARHYLAGSVEVDSDGFEGKPLRLKVTADDPADKPGSWPEAEAKIDDDTWGAIGTIRRAAEDGRHYPTVFGGAGQIIQGGSFAFTTAIPVIPIMLSTTANRFVVHSPWGDIRSTGGGWWTYPAVPDLLAYGIIAEDWVYPGPVGSASRGLVTGWRVVSGGTTVPAPVTNCELVYATDVLGRRVTLVDRLVQAAAGTLLEDYSYYVAISPPCVGGYNQTYSSGLSGAGEIVRFALQKSNVLVDWKRANPAFAILDRFKLAGFWDDPCDPWSWLVDNVFPLLPCSWAAGPNGVYPIIWRLDANAHNADAVLTDGIDCTIDGPVKREGEPISRHSIEYGYGIFQDTYRRTATWHGNPTQETIRESTSLHLRRAQLRYGSRKGSEYIARARSEQSNVLYSDAAADRILAWQARMMCQPQQVLRIVSDGLHHRSRVGALEPGMAVALNSDRYSFTSRVGFVRRAGWLGGIAYADIVILSEP